MNQIGLDKQKKEEKPLFSAVFMTHHPFDLMIQYPRLYRFEGLPAQ